MFYGSLRIFQHISLKIRVCVSTVVGRKFILEYHLSVPARTIQFTMTLKIWDDFEDKDVYYIYIYIYIYIYNEFPYLVQF